MEEKDKPVANPLIVLREEFDDWAILFNPDTGETYGLNPVSVLIWKNMDGKHSVEDISNEIRENCENTPEDVNGHVEEFIATMEEKGLAGYEK